MFFLFKLPLFEQKSEKISIWWEVDFWIKHRILKKSWEQPEHTNRSPMWCLILAWMPLWSNVRIKEVMKALLRWRNASKKRKKTSGKNLFVFWCIGTLHVKMAYRILFFYDKPWNGLITIVNFTVFWMKNEWFWFILPNRIATKIQ